MDKCQLVYKKPRLGLVLKDPIQTIESQTDIYEKLRFNNASQLIATSSEDNCVLFLLQDTNINMVARFKADFAQKEPYINDAIINYKGTLLATGGDDGIVRLWQKDNDYNFLKLHEFTEDKQKIQSLDFHVSQPLLIAACENYECKIINYNNQSVIKKLTITQNNVYNLKFNCAYFSLDEQHIITIKNPMRGASYMTVWQMKNETIDPIKTMKVNNHPITASCLSTDGIFLGVGGADGTAKIINLRHCDFEATAQPHDMVIKGISFTNDSRFLVSGATDFTYNFLANIRPEGWFSKITKMWVLVMIIIYLIELMIRIFE